MLNWLINSLTTFFKYWS